MRSSTALHRIGASPTTATPRSRGIVAGDVSPVTSPDGRSTADKTLLGSGTALVGSDADAGGGAGGAARGPGGGALGGRGTFGPGATIERDVSAVSMTVVVFGPGVDGALGAGAPCAAASCATADR